MKRYCLGAACAAAITVLALGAAPGAAAVTVYTDRAAFLAATTDHTTDSFDMPAGEYFAYGFDPYVGAGFEVTDNDGNLYNIDGAVDPGFYDWGSGAIMHFSENGTATFTLAPGRTAFGIDLMSVNNMGATIAIGGLTNAYSVTTVARPNRTFFGAVSDTAIEGFTLTAIGAYGQFDNLTLASAGAVVPEPASWAMLIVGFGIVGAAMRRRPKAQLATA